MHRYEVIINGVETTLLLSDADAQARGLTPVAKKVAAKADTPADKAAPAPANKSRTPRNKQA